MSLSFSTNNFAVGYIINEQHIYKYVPTSINPRVYTDSQERKLIFNITTLTKNRGVRSANQKALNIKELKRPKYLKQRLYSTIGLYHSIMELKYETA